MSVSRRLRSRTSRSTSLKRVCCPYKREREKTSQAEPPTHHRQALKRLAADAGTGLKRTRPRILSMTLAITSLASTAAESLCSLLADAIAAQRGTPRNNCRQVTHPQ